MPALDLAPDTIVQVTRELISEHGVEGFSMRKLAAALDVNPMTIYLRFENKDALLDAVVSASLAEFVAPAPEGPWSEQVRALAAGLRQHLIADRHTLRLLGDGDRLTTSLLGTLDRGLELMAVVTSTPEDAVAAFRMLFWHVVGSALVAGTFQALPGTRTDLPSHFARTSDDLPHLAAHARHFGPVDGEQLFIRTTDLLIDGFIAAAPETIS